MSVLGKGTRKELMLARRAIKVARAHLSQARCGLDGAPDALALAALLELADIIKTIACIPELAREKDRKAA